MQRIQMVDLLGQYDKIKEEILASMTAVIESSGFINGPEVSAFEKSLAAYTQSKHCISCANGTDALQIAFMALGLQPGDEIIIPAFTYIATVETAALLGLKIILCDVEKDTFNIDAKKIEGLITSKTKAIVPVHLFGQCADMEAISLIAQKYNLFVVEDNAQAIGAEYTFSNHTKKAAGTIGTIGTSSFFPSKNLGCYGDGGALFTQDSSLANTLKMVANHGQNKKYYHDIIGINSRLDTLQAAILNVKIKHLEKYISARQSAAAYYDEKLKGIRSITLPARSLFSTHVFHQYTLVVNSDQRDDLKLYLEKNEIPSMIYYPLPVHYQKAYEYLGYKKGDFPVAEDLCGRIISLPIHTELNSQQLDYICTHLIKYFN
jgi:UDP-2-acetamido-2-deoxy-ribo-hexuluronate aminotransferase